MKCRPFLILTAALAYFHPGPLPASGTNPTAPGQTTLNFSWLDEEDAPAKIPPSAPINPVKRAEAAAAFAQGKQLEEHEDYDNALIRYRQASEADPGYTPTLLRYAAVCLKCNRTQDAIDFLQSCLKAQPDSARLRSLLALAYEQKSNTGEASRQARRALELDPTLIDNYSVLVKELEREGRKKAINDLFDRAKSTRSDKASYYIRMGDLWTQLLTENALTPKKQIQQQVLPFYEQAAKLDPANAHLLVQLGQLAFDAEKYDKAADYYQRAYEINHRISNLRESLAIALLSARREPEAIKVLESLLEDYPERKGLYTMLGNLYAQENNWDKAAEYYLLYCKLGDARLQDYLRLADAQLHTRKTDDALETMDRVVDENPQLPEAHYLHGVVLRSLGRWQESLDAFAKCETLAPNDPKTLNSVFYLQYAEAWLGLGNQSKAEELLQKSLQLDPKNHEALNCLGYTWADKGVRLNDAYDYISRALKLDPKNKAYLDSMGWVLYQKGNYSKALVYLNQAVENGVEDPTLQTHLGDTLYKLGRYQDAIEAWTKAQARTKDGDALAAKIDQARHQLAQKP